jgi:hypothetical protein
MAKLVVVQEWELTHDRWNTVTRPLDRDVEKDRLLIRDWENLDHHGRVRVVDFEPMGGQQPLTQRKPEGR